MTKLTPKPVQERAAKTARLQAVSPQEKISVLVPVYLLDAMRLQAARDRSSLRYILMRALRDAGYVIKPQDIFANGRRTMGRRKRQPGTIRRAG